MSDLSLLEPSAAPDDARLLAEYLRTRSRQALGELISRHMDFVYRCALRLTHDPHVADDITQAVFIVLATRAHKIRSAGVLPGWLFNVVRYAAADARRSRDRRLHYERKWPRPEILMPEADTDSSPAADAMAHLDEAIASLSQRERDVVVLRYLKDKSAPEVSAALGISEPVVYKRSQRAVERLRRFLAKRGLTAEATAIESVIHSTRHGASAPTGLLDHTLGVAIAASMGHVSAPAGAAWGIAKGVLKIMARAQIKKTIVAVALVLFSLIGAGGVLFYELNEGGEKVTVPAPVTPVVQGTGVVTRPVLSATVLTARQPVILHDPGLASMPYAAGWPIALPGEIDGTPAVADVEGNGHLCVIVASAQFADSRGPHAHPDHATLLYALRGDGTVVPGWPAVIAPPTETIKAWNWWTGTPSIFKTNGQTFIAINSRAFHTQVVGSDGQILRRPRAKGDATSAVTAVDLTGNGTISLFSGMEPIPLDINGQRLPTWGATYVPPQGLSGGYSPCVGDALGNGQPVLFYTTHNSATINHVFVVGLNRNGQLLDGWPHLVPENHLFSPVIGNITGGKGMEVIQAAGSYLFAWTADGQPLPCDTTDGPYTGVFKSNVYSAASTVALADLEGTGNADVVIYDENSSCLRAWRGDGTGINTPPGTSTTASARPLSIWKMLGVGTPSVAGPDDGSVIAQLPAQGQYGVSVVSLGDDPGTTDFFTGTYWVRRTRAGKTTITNMLPSQATPIHWNQPTVCDLFGDGKAEVIFGLPDGRLFVYKTSLTYHADRADWPTELGNFQHTGVWNRP